MKIYYFFICMKKQIFFLGAFAIFSLPTVTLAEVSSQKTTNIEQEILIKRIEDLEKEIQTLKSLVKSQSSIKSTGSKELITKEAKNDDIAANFTGRYVNLSIGNGNLNETSDISAKCSPTCEEDGSTYHYPSSELHYGFSKGESDPNHENSISLALGKNWQIGDYVTGLRGGISYGKGGKLTSIFDDVNTILIRNSADSNSPQLYEETNTLNIIPSNFKSELTFLVGRPFNKVMPYLYTGIEGRQFKTELNHSYISTNPLDQLDFEIGEGINTEEKFNIAPIIGIGLSYALSPKVNIDWKAGFNFHELENTIDSHTLKDYLNLEYQDENTFDESSTTTKTDLTEFNTQIGVNFFF